MRGTRTVVLALAGLWLMPPLPGGAEGPEVVVSSARHYGQEAAYDAFTRKTGVQVKIFNGNTGELFERLKAEGDKTPADILLTVDAGNLWNAARAGLLSRVDSPELQANIPARLRDPEGRWFGLTVRARTIVYNTRKVRPAELSTYEALGDPRWKGRLCLRTSSYIYNQSLLATMIKRHGEVKTEEIVRGWVANQPSLINGDAKILEAIAAGQCDVGLVNHYYLARLLAKDPTFPVAIFWANQHTTGTHVNVSGAGVTAHARHRAQAIKFLESLSSAEAQQMFADLSYEYPANLQATVSSLVERWGRFKQDDVNVASAGGVQAAATKLAVLVGVGAGTMIVGTGLAWLVVGYRFPGRAVFEWALMLPLAVPAYVIGFAFLGLFDYAGPVQTALRHWLGGHVRLPELRSYGGVVLMMTLVFYPYVYLLARAAFREQGAATLETARSLGRTRLRAFLEVALPMARPSLVAGVSLAMMEAPADFGTVATFGYRTLTEAIYRAWLGTFDRTAATQLASLLLLFAFLLLGLERALRGRARFVQSHRRRRGGW